MVINKSIYYKILLLIICTSITIHVKATIKKFNVTDITYSPSPLQPAKGDGVTDDREAILRVINAAESWLTNSKTAAHSQAIIFFPAPSNVDASKNFYLINSFTSYPFGGERLHNYAFPIYSNMEFEGEATPSGTSTLKFGDHLFDGFINKDDDAVKGTGLYANANMFYGSFYNYTSNVVFKDLTIDFNGLHNILPAGQDDLVGTNLATGKIKTIYGILIFGGRNVTITGVTMLNNPGQDDIMMYAAGSNLTVQNCIFKNGGRDIGDPVVQNSYSHDFSFVYSEWDSSTFRNDSIIQEYPEITLQKGSFSGGIEIHGGHATMEDNYIFGCKPAVYVGSGNRLSVDYSKDNKPMENVQIINNKMIDCFGGLTLLTKNPINQLTIDGNTIKIMFLKKSSLFNVIPDANFHLISCINYVGGDEPCHSNYELAGSYYLSNANLKPITNLNVANNDLSFDTNSGKPDYLITTGMILHSLHNGVIKNNTIKNMNWSGISLGGSPWQTNNVTISGNTISDFLYCLNKYKNYAAYIYISDFYRPNNNCDPAHQQTYNNILITGNNFISNDVDTYENLHCDYNRTYSCFNGIYFDVPSWYGYTSVTAPYTALNKNAFNVSSNTFTNTNETQLYHSADCSGLNKCLDKSNK